jgi:hypothetical protein
MFADAALFHMSYPLVIFFCCVQLTIVLAVAWFGTRHRPGDFRFGRVIGLTLLCLVTSLPFAYVAYLLWPWDMHSWILRADIFLAVFAPIITAYILGIVRKRKLMRR